MSQSSKIVTFWQEYLATLSEEERNKASAYLVDDFADTPEAATQVGKLVRDGIKTTTSSLLWGLEHIGEPLPKVGDWHLQNRVRQIIFVLVTINCSRIQNEFQT